MKTLIENYIVDFIRKYEKQDEITTTWGKPIVGYGDVNHDYIKNIRKYAYEKHLMPQDVLKDSTIILAYFIPFIKDIANSNIGGEIASETWTLAYEETNEMFVKLNKYIIHKIQDMGYKASVCDVAGDFEQDVLKSKWSHRHMARAAGLGTFGVNNMLITKKGCCGRYYTIVTNLPVEPDEFIQEEYCLYKKDKSCLACVKNCPSGALTNTNYDRFKCYETCMKSFDKFESMYGNKQKQNGKPRGGSEVCGKCVVNLPCSFKKDK